MTTDESRKRNVSCLTNQEAMRDVVDMIRAKCGHVQIKAQLMEKHGCSIGSGTLADIREVLGLSGRRRLYALSASRSRHLIRTLGPKSQVQKPLAAPVAKSDAEHAPVSEPLTLAGVIAFLKGYLATHGIKSVTVSDTGEMRLQMPH